MKAQRGFTLLETLISMAIASAFIVAITGAVLASLHAVTHASSASDMEDHALNLLSDLREATAYDPSALTALEGKTSRTTFPASTATNAPALIATIAISQPVATSDPVIATVTVGDGSGTVVTEQRTLFSEAPAPGSVVEASPSPSPT